MFQASIETIIELIGDLVKREYGMELKVVYLQGGCFEAYQRTIDAVSRYPVDVQRGIVVSVCLEEIELLRYPALDIEFNLQEGAEKLGCTGPQEGVAEFMRLISIANSCVDD